MNTNDNLLMTSRWLAEATRLLTSNNIPTARLDSLILLEDLTGKDRSWLLAHPEHRLSVSQAQKLRDWLRRRSKHEPLSYIRGKTEFYGYEFIVNAHTLEPRPETETMIDLLKRITEDAGTIVDVGTGSGCIAVTAKLELPKLTVIGTDIDTLCIRTARQNAKNLGADVAFYEADLLHSQSHSIFQIPSSVFAILANLPYVPDSYKLNQAALHEPPRAIFGGKDGLDLYRQLLVQINKLDIVPRYVFTESLPFQHQDLAQLFENSKFHQVQQDDFIQVFERKT